MMIAFIPCTGGEIGRRARLRTSFPQGCVGSIPTLCTKRYFLFGQGRAALRRGRAGGQKPPSLRDEMARRGDDRWADLLRTAWFVPIFWTKEAISAKLSDEDKKAACFVSKTHSRNGSTQLFPRCSKSFFSVLKTRVARIVSSFCLRYTSFGMSPSKYADTSFSMRVSLAFNLSARF